MDQPLGMQRLQRTLLIHRVVQMLLFILFVYMALHFQENFKQQQMPHVFRNSLLATLLLQFILFFPLRHFASGEARREVAVASAPADAEQQKQLRQQRLFCDTLKGAVFLGFSVFILLAPPVTFVLSTAFFSFIATVITYLQCFNFAVRSQLRQPPAP